MIRYEKEDRDFRLSDHFTVGGLWLNNELDHIMVDGAPVRQYAPFSIKKRPLPYAKEQ